MKTLPSYCLGIVLLLLALSSSAQDCNLTNPQNLPWIQELISNQNCNCNEYIEHRCYENESIFIIGFTSPFCNDYTTTIYDADGDILCILGGLLGNTCENELPNLGNSELLSLVWACENQDCICTDEYDPVCGVNGNTYSNACQAACEGITILAEGLCDQNTVFENICYTQQFDHFVSELGDEEGSAIGLHPSNGEAELLSFGPYGNGFHLRYTPNTNFIGTDIIRVDISDYSNFQTGPPTVTEKHFAITVEDCATPSCLTGDSPFSFPWIQETISNADGCQVDQIKSFDYNGDTYFVTIPGYSTAANLCPTDQPILYYTCQGELVCFQGFTPFPTCSPTLITASASATLVWQYNNETICGTQSIYDIPWLTSYIDNCHYDAIYAFQFQGQEMIYVESTPICSGESAYLADLGSPLFDCEGNIICFDGGYTFIETQCSFQGIDVGSFINEQNLIWTSTPEPCICTSEYAPVCGVDGLTYGNACEAACEGVEILYNGACDNTLCGVESIYDLPWLSTYIDNCNYDAIYFIEIEGEEHIYIQYTPNCPEEFLYIADLLGNILFDCSGNVLCYLGGELIQTATCASIETAVYNQLTPENLVWPLETEPCICTSEYAPVCGVDGNTYGNACEAACEGVEILYNGACDNTLCGVESIYDLPWLSTYIDDCHYDAIYSVEIEGEEHIYVQSTPMCPGELFYIADLGDILFDCSGNVVCYLGGELIQSAACASIGTAVYNQLTPENLVWPLETEPCICTQQYAPVCGIDGNTYGNACEAACEGVEILYNGACDNTLCGAVSAYNLPWLSTYIEDCHYDAIYAFEHAGQEVIYVQYNPGCILDDGSIPDIADFADILFDCEGNVICLNGGFTTPESQCSFQNIDISSYLINENLVWTPTVIAVNLNNVNNKVLLNTNIYLQGAYTNSTDDLMRDDLRLYGLIPLNEPYAAMDSFNHIGGESIKSSLLNSPGPNAIVDWVLIELINPINNNVLASRAALLQRNGTIVDIDGASPVAFTLSSGAYNVCIKHRNHLCVVTENAYTFNIGVVTTVDNNNITMFGENTLVEMPFGKKAMWGGSPSGNGIVAFQGPNNTPNHVFFEIVTDPANTTLSANYIKQFVYNNGDLDMNGQVIYQGANSDVNFNFFTIIQHPENTSIQVNYTIQEQQP